MVAIRLDLKEARLRVRGGVRGAPLEEGIPEVAELEGRTRMVEDTGEEEEVEVARRLSRQAELCEQSGSGRDRDTLTPVYDCHLHSRWKP
jgi:hypothetical protein